jgi:hypothetical protein
MAAVTAANPPAKPRKALPMAVMVAGSVLARVSPRLLRASASVLRTAMRSGLNAVPMIS